MGHGQALLDILVVLLAAKVAAEAAERARLPAVVGEILAGVVVGPSVLGLVEGGEVLRVLGEIGVILLLLEVGLEMDLAGLGAVGRRALVVAVTGVAAPFALGAGVAAAAGQPGHVAIFVGAALTATSVGITARVFADLRALASPEARTVLGAAVADDVLGLLILTIVARVATGGGVSAAEIAVLVVLAVGFLVIATVAGVRLAPALFGAVHRHARGGGTPVALALAFTLALAQVASAAHLAPIVGAFVAGLALAGTDQAERIHRQLRPVGHLFVPVFFLQIGIDVRVGELVRPEVLGMAAGLLAAAAAGKLVTAAAVWGTPVDGMVVGLGMLPRGEVGLIFATLGRQSGVLGDDLYAALLVVVLVTTLVTPPLLRWRLVRRRPSRGVPAAAPPEGGWLRADPGTVDLAAEPPRHMALDLALEAALLAGSGRRPGPALLDWLAASAGDPVRWTPAATERLFALLRDGTVRSWRLLEAAGVLERALPELAEVVARRRSDPFELDPAGVLRWSLVERLRDLGAEDRAAAAEVARLEHPAWLLLAALVLDTAGADADPGVAVAAARRLVGRLDLGAEAEQEVALLVGESGLLRAAALRPDGLAEEAVLGVAGHLDRPERSRALYLLSLAVGDLDPAWRHRLDDLHGLVQEALVHPELASREARNLVSRRRAEAARLAGDPAVASRIHAAPRGYLLARPTTEVARHARLAEPVPRPGEVRVAVARLAGPDGNGNGAGAGDTWRVEVAARDRPGLLARVAGALDRSGLEVLEAVVATWPDGAAIQSYRLRPRPGARAPEAASLEEAAARSFGERLAPAPVPEASVTFDGDASPWYTRAHVRARSRSGLLGDVTAAVAAAGGDIHSARLTMQDGSLRAWFELTDGRGRKLAAPGQEAVRRALVEGAPPGRGPRRRRPVVRR